MITGGAGFIGSQLCERFLSLDYAVTAIDNLVTGSRDNLKTALSNPNFQFLEWDVSQPIPLDQCLFLETRGLEGILHFACPASPVDFDKIPYEILKVDSYGTFHTLEIAQKYQARYILASTSEIYGDPLEHPQKETYWGNVSTTGPRACYDETKRFAEAVITTAMRKDNLNAGIVRIFNTYGPRMRADDGRVVTEFINQCLKKIPITIHGDGSQTRSFCFVTDLVDGIVKLYKSSQREIFNLGNPVEMTIKDMAEKVVNMVNPGNKIDFVPGREDDPKKRRPDITKAKEILNWEPKVSFEDGIKKTIEFYESSSRS